MNQAYIDEVAKDKNDVMHLQVRQDLFDATVDAKRKKDKEILRTSDFLNVLTTKKSRRETFGRRKRKICWRALKFLRNRWGRTQLYNE